MQGLGWLTTKELKWDRGRSLTHSPDTYKIPSVGDTPQIFNVTLLQNATQKNVIHGSKAIGEPPLMLAISVRERFARPSLRLVRRAGKCRSQCPPPARRFGLRFRNAKTRRLEWKRNPRRLRNNYAGTILSPFGKQHDAAH